MTMQRRSSSIRGTDSKASLLTSIRVLEIGHFVAAPFATRLLADLGADVIKIEARDGDPVRQWGEQIDNRSLWWSLHGRNKRSVTLNLKDPRGRDIALRLAACSDVVVENFRPGHLAKLGLGDVELRNARPDLVIAHISGFGQNGPYRDRSAFGVIGEAIGGLRYITDHPAGTGDLPPVRVGISIGDSLAGLYAAFGVMAALWNRDRANGLAPRTLDIALTDSVLSVMEGMLPEFGALGKIKQPTGGAIATAAPSNAYPTLDGAWILIAANSDPLFAKLMCAMGRSELVDVPRFNNNRARLKHAQELDTLIANWTTKYTIGELIPVLSNADIPNSKIYTAADCADDPQYLQRRMVQQVFDPAFARDILHTGIVPHVNEAPGSIRWPGPEIGAHNAEVLTGLLGIPADELRRLRQQGVV